MQISSPAFLNNGFIPKRYTCDGENINPPLHIEGAPMNTKSLVLIVEDPDAPTKTWVHWIVYNIDPSITDIPENSVPKNAIEGMTDFGKPQYGGPCPPSGTHRYFFKLYALDAVLIFDIEDPQSVTKQMLEEKMKPHIIDYAELVGKYSRNKS